MTFLKNFNNSKHIFLYSSMMVMMVFLVTRLQYFLDYPVFVFSSDSASYCDAAFNIMNLHAPLFDIRTPAYPLFLALVWTFSKSMFTLALTQSVLTIICSLLFLFMIYRSYRSLTFLFAISLSVYISSSYYLVLEKALLTEGIFVNVLLLSAGTLIVAIKKNCLSYWILFSLLSALLVLIRPAALFLAGIFLMVAIFFFINKFGLRYYAALVIPSAVILLLLCSYNYATIRQFTITPFGEANLSGVTVLFMEESPEYTPLVNEAIRNTLDSIPGKSKSYIRNSFGISKLYHTFNDNFYRQVNLTEYLMKRDSSINFMTVRPILKEISVDAISKHPEIYMKFFASNFIFFFNNVRIVMDYYDQMLNIYKRTVFDKKYIEELESGRWRQVSSGKSDHREIIKFFEEEVNKQNGLENVIISGDSSAEFKRTFSGLMYSYYEKVYNFLFRNFLWVILYGVVMIVSAIGLLKSRFRDRDYFMIFLICSIFVIKAIFVSLVEVALVRYSYTVEFAIYFSLPFIFLILKKKKNTQPA